MIYPQWMPMSWSPRISPPTWALTVELVFYLLICLGISRNRKLTFLWLAASAAYHAMTHVLGLDWNHRYSSIPAGSLPFAMGAALFHLRPALMRLAPWLTRLHGIGTLTALYLANLLAGCLTLLLNWNATLGELHFYLNLVLSFLMVFALSAASPPKTLRRLDAAFGDYSYPIYLLHYPLGMFLSHLIFGEVVRGFSIQGCLLFVITTPACFAVSYLTIRLIDHPIQQIRQKVKASQTAPSPC